jgi:hypothetical protein
MLSPFVMILKKSWFYEPITRNRAVNAMIPNVIRGCIIVRMRKKYSRKTPIEMMMTSDGDASELKKVSKAAK